MEFRAISYSASQRLATPISMKVAESISLHSCFAGGKTGKTKEKVCWGHPDYLFPRQSASKGLLPSALALYFMPIRRALHSPVQHLQSV